MSDYALVVVCGWFRGLGFLIWFKFEKLIVSLMRNMTWFECFRFQFMGIYVVVDDIFLGSMNEYVNRNRSTL